MVSEKLPLHKPLRSSQVFVLISWMSMYSRAPAMSSVKLERNSSPTTSWGLSATYHTSKTEMLTVGTLSGLGSKDAGVVANEKYCRVGVGGISSHGRMVSGIKNRVKAALGQSSLAKLVSHGLTALDVPGVQTASRQLVLAVSKRTLVHVGHSGPVLESFGLMLA